MRFLPRVLGAVALTAALTACGGSVESGSQDGAGTTTEAPTDDASDDMSDDTSMPADEDAEHDGSVSEGEAEAVGTAYLGLTEDEAVAQAEVDGRDFRVGARDGEQFMLTQDYVIGRVTATITDGVITEVVVEATDGPVTVTQ